MNRMCYKKYICISIFLFFIIANNYLLFSCTGIFLTTKNQSHIYARTLEFGQELPSSLLFIPRNYRMVATAPSEKKEGLAWNSTYAAIGINAFGLPHFIDGVNEKGLAGGLFYFPGFAHYQNVIQKNYSQSLAIWELLTWILTTCATTAQVRQQLPSVLVSNTLFPQFQEILPAHLIVHDAHGTSIVIEYIQGTLTIHDNPLGVITNSPNFDWHLTNIRNYLNISPLATQSKTMSGIPFSPLGQGSGMFGLPGDFTPPSRFIRAVAFTQAAHAAATELDGIYQAFHLLNNFDIPKHVAIDRNGKTDYTQWTSAIDLKNKVVYFRPYGNFQLSKIELMKRNLNATSIKTFSMTYKDIITEIY